MASGTAANGALEEVGSGLYAYVQTGSWGFSNAGLVTSGSASLLVDTLYDLRLTRQMLDAMQRATPAANEIDTVVNTHANGDHCWGNQLMSSSTIVSSRAAADEMRELPPKLMYTLVQASRAVVALGAAARAPLRLLGRLGIARASALEAVAPFIADNFGSFDFGKVSLRVPNETFEGELELSVGDKLVRLIEVGPAHTRGDVIAYVPSDRVVFTGDILFMGSHPIAWNGPVRNWVAACDRILGLDVDVVVPGHGPLTDKKGVTQLRDYWAQVIDGAERAHTAGLSIEEAARELLRQLPYDWTEASRLVVNVDTLYREIEHDSSTRDPLAMLAQMARFEA